MRRDREVPYLGASPPGGMMPSPPVVGDGGHTSYSPSPLSTLRRERDPHLGGEVAVDVDGAVLGGQQRILLFCHRDSRRSPRSSSSGPRVCSPCANRVAKRALTVSERTSCWNRLASARIASAPGSVSSLSTCLVDCTASAGNDAMRRASRATNSSSSASG